MREVILMLQHFNFAPQFFGASDVEQKKRHLNNDMGMYIYVCIHVCTIVVVAWSDFIS